MQVLILRILKANLPGLTARMAILQYGRNPFRTTLTPRLKQLLAGIYRGIIIPGFFRWCEMDFVHPQNSMIVKHPFSQYMVHSQVAAPWLPGSYRTPGRSGPLQPPANPSAGQTSSNLPPQENAVPQLARGDGASTAGEKCTPNSVAILGPKRPPNKC